MRLFSITDVGDCVRNGAADSPNRHYLRSYRDDHEPESVMDLLPDRVRLAWSICLTNELFEFFVSTPQTHLHLPI